MKKLKERWWIFVIAAVILVAIGIVGRFTFLGYYWTSIGDQSIGVETVAGNVTRVLPPGIHTNGKLWADLYEIDISQLPWCAVDPEVLTKDSQRLGFVVCGTVQRPGLTDLISAEPKDVNDTDTGDTSETDVVVDVGTDTDSTGADTDKEKTTYYQYNKGQYWIGYKIYFLKNTLLAGKYHTETNPRNTNEQLYIIDEAGLMQQLAQQAMKSCVGDRTFEEAVVGSKRDELRSCIDNSVSELATNYGGLKVENVVVPNILIGDEVAVKLDAITQAKFDTQLELQKKEQALAEGQRLLAVKQAEIRVEQGSIQETATQEKKTLELQAAAEKARDDLIRAQKANELLQAQLQIGINQTNLNAAEIEVQIKHIWEITLAELMLQNPTYANYLVLQLATTAWDEMDKVVVPIGSDPYTIINPWGNTTPFVNIE